MPTLAELIQYYVNLIIIQYAINPNAQAEIALLVGELLADDIYFDVQQGYNIQGSNIAIGKQLDIIGKYVGVDRFYSGINLINYFSMVTYSQKSSLPDSPPQFGFETYATFAGDNDYNGTLVYGDIFTSNNQLSDSSFYILIHLAIILNNSNLSDQQIDAELYKFFGTSIRAEDIGSMQMIFFVTSALTPLISAIIEKNILPVPMSVGSTVIGGITGDMFALTDYYELSEDYESPFGASFSTYANYATLSGQVLTYSQIS